jgi:hypothetical protein
LISHKLTGLPSAKSRSDPSPTPRTTLFTHTTPHCIVVAKEQEEQDEWIMMMAAGFAIVTIKGTEENASHIR